MQQILALGRWSMGIQNQYHYDDEKNQSQDYKTGIVRVNVHSVESIILNQLDSTADESSSRTSAGDEVEVTVLRIGPATDGEKNFKVS